MKPSIVIATADPQVLRPRDLRGVYAQPAKEASRLASEGVLLRLAHGYYAVVPERYRGTRWRPATEAAALGIAQADHGRDGAVAMGPTAARLLDAIPRAVGSAVIAVARQRPMLETSIGRIHFVKRNLRRLEKQRCRTELATGWTTTAEQTVLDLADRPTLGGLPPREIAEAIERLSEDVDWKSLGRLGREQHKSPAAIRAAWVAGVEPPIKSGRPVLSLGLPGHPGAGRERYGVV